MVALRFSLPSLFPRTFPSHNIFQFQLVYQSCSVAQFLPLPVAQVHLYIWQCEILLLVLLFWSLWTPLELPWWDTGGIIWIKSVTNNIFFLKFSVIYSVCCACNNLHTPIYAHICMYAVFFFMALQPIAGHGLLILYEVSRSHTTTHHIQYDSSGWVISSSQRPVPDNTQHSQQTNIHATGGIRTHNLSRRAAADLRLRPRGHWDRRSMWWCI